MPVRGRHSYGPLTRGTGCLWLCLFLGTTWTDASHGPCENSCSKRRAVWAGRESGPGLRRHRSALSSQ